MTGKAKRPGVYNVIPRPDTWAWKTKRILEHPNSDTHGLVTGLVAKGDTKKLTSVTYTTWSGTTEQGASLIVDCSGLARVGLKLLKRLVNLEAFET